MAVMFCVRLDIRVHKIEWYSPHLNLPHLRMDATTRELDLHDDLITIGVSRRDGRDLSQIQLVVNGDLIALGIQLLPEVALGVQETDSDERHSEIG
jgi:hypothetical protein